MHRLSKYDQDSPLPPKVQSTFITCVEQIKDTTCHSGGERGFVPCT